VSFAKDLVALAAICAAAYTITTVFRLILSFLTGGGTNRSELAGVEQRLARLEASMENMSAETQRLADGHRFFTDLLVDRKASVALPRSNPAATSNQNGSR
jgi:hypothetical protein